VPAGFTITTEACVAYMRAERTEPHGLDEQVAHALIQLQEHAGRWLGDPSDPLLVSVRSGRAGRCRACSTPSSTWA
jgi:pyruvate, orthophosphate dikinase